MTVMLTTRGASALLIFALISLACRCAYAVTCGAQTFSNPAGTYSASWYIDCDDQSIIVSVTTQSGGWIAWGVNSDPNMPNADIAYFYVNASGSIVINDCKNNQEGTPPSPDVTIGGQNNIYNYAATQTASSSTLTFTRKLNTGDLTDLVISDAIPGYLLWAFGASNRPGHGNNRDGVAMNFGTSCCPAVPTAASSSSSSLSSSSSTGGATSTVGLSSTVGASSSTTGGSNGCTPGAVFKGSASNSLNTWKMSWVIDCDPQTINITTTATTTGWLGMGLGVSTLMYPGDIVMAYVDDSTSVAHASDRWASAHAQPRLDTELGGNDGISGVTGSQVGSTTTVSWTRSLAAGDQYDLAIVPQDMNVLWAISSTDDLGSQHDNSDAIIVNFYTGKVATNNVFNKKLAHGIFMLLAFGIMFAPAAYVAAYLKPIGHTWYIVHVATNIIASVLFLIGFALIVSEKSDTKNAHFVVPHERIGLAMFIMIAAQIILGFLANALWSPERKGTPIFPDKMHWVLGITIIILGFANVQLGFERYGFVAHALSIIQGLFYVVIAVSILCWVIGRIWIIVKKDEASHDGKGLPKFLISTLLVWLLIGFVFIIVIAAEMYKYGK